MQIQQTMPVYFSGFAQDELLAGKAEKKISYGEYKELALLRGMGLRNYEIAYLMHLKMKERMRDKWRSGKKH